MIWFTGLGTVAEGIVKEAVVFTGKVLAQDFFVFFVNDADESLSNIKCKIKQDGKIMEAKTGGDGHLKFCRKGKGKIEIALLEGVGSGKSRKPVYPADEQKLPVLELCNKRFAPNPIKGHGPLGNQVSVPSKMYYDNSSGDRDELIKRLHSMLDNLLYPLGSEGVNGKFGSYTEKDVKEFQSENKGVDRTSLVREDGKIGPMSADALNRAIVGMWFPFYETPTELTKDTLLVTVTEDELKKGITIDPKDRTKVKIVVVRMQSNITKIEWMKKEVVAFDGLKKENRKVTVLVETDSIADDANVVLGICQYKKDGSAHVVQRVKDVKIKKSKLVGTGDKPYEFEFKWHPTIYGYKRSQYFIKAKTGRIVEASEQTRDNMIRLIHLDGIVANPDGTLGGADKEGIWVRNYLKKKGLWVEATVDELKKDGHEVVGFRGRASNVTIRKFRWLVGGNKFLHHQASHGIAYCYNHVPKVAVERTGKQGADGADNWHCPICKNLNNVVGAICLDTTVDPSIDFEKGHVQNLIHGPKVLVFANCCLTAITDVYPKAWLRKNTQWYIGWAEPVDDGAAVAFAKSFYRRWFKHYKMNPDKVLNTFNDIQGTYSQYRPRIFKK